MSREKIYYAGIGSQKTCIEQPLIGKEMQKIAKELALSGWVLRSGGANGADTAFETGCDEVNGAKEIFLPWKGFNSNPSPLFGVCEAAKEIARSIIPYWDKLSNNHRLLHGRNVYQILGKDLNTPVSQVLYWAPVNRNGVPMGGTATAVKLAWKYGIDVEIVRFNNGF